MKKNNLAGALAILLTLIGFSAAWGQGMPNGGGVTPSLPPNASQETGGNLDAIKNAVQGATPAGTNSIGTVQPGNTANTTPWLVQEPDANALSVAAVAGTGNASVTSATNLFSLDTSGYNGIALQITSAGSSCTISFEASNDNSTWTAVNLQSFTTNSGSSLLSSTSNANNLIGPLNARYFRARVSTYGSGTVTASYALRRSFFTNGVFLAGTPPVLAQLSASTAGAYSYSHIPAGQATTTVKSGAGTLHAIVLNGAATATNVTTIYDNTAASGTVIGIPAATTATLPTTIIYDLAFATGLTINTVTANGSDMTVVYK